jgi:calreticulin
MKAILFLTFFAAAAAKIYFEEEFGAGWENRWVQSKHDSGYGKFVASPGKFYGDKERDTGIKTSQDAKFYAISAKYPSFSNKDKALVVQYTVKHEQGIDCGGGYLKLGPDFDQTDFHGDTKYNIMFGPDICGATKRTHLIFNYKGENHLKKSDIRTESDELTHLYTLILKPDQTFDVQIDQKSVSSGSLLEGWNFLPPKEIPDPNVSKPEDWVDEAMIADPTDSKPADWDDVPEFIPDPDAEKPEDWDDEEDGEWEAPTIPNPDYKGEWSPKMIENPAYKGEWVHPMIPNPAYHEDNNIYAFNDFSFVGIDIWQVKAGSIFDNIIITDDVKEAEDHAARTWAKLKTEEKKKSDEDKEEKKKTADEERAKRDAEIKADEDGADDDDDDLKSDDAAKAKKEKLDALKKKQEHVHEDL